MSSPEFMSAGKLKLDQLRRSGYELLLEGWMNDFTDQISVLAQAENVPSSCDVGEIREQILAKQQTGTCSSDKKVFFEALSNILGGTSDQWSKPGMQLPTSLDLVRDHTLHKRFYPSSEPGKPSLVNCMEPPQAAALTFLRSKGGESIFPNVRELKTDLLEIEEIITNQNTSMEELRDVLLNTGLQEGRSKTLRTLNLLYNIFPGLKVELQNKMLGTSKEALLPTIKLLLGYATNIAKLKVTDLASSDPAVKRRFLDSLQHEGLRVTESLRDRLVGPNPDTDNSTLKSTMQEVGQRCVELVEKISHLSCAGENFTAIPKLLPNMPPPAADLFLERAARFSQSHGLQSLSADQYATCNEQRRADRAGAVMAECRSYFTARCLSSQQPADSTAGSPSQINWRVASSAIEVQEKQRSEESSVIADVCGDFNTFIAERACKNFLGDQEAYFECARNVSPDGAYGSYLTERNIKFNMVSELASRQWGYGTMGMAGAELNTTTARSFSRTTSTHSFADRNPSSAPTSSPAAAAVTMDSILPTPAAAKVASVSDSMIKRTPASRDLVPEQAPTPEEAATAELDLVNQQIADAQARLAALREQGQTEKTQQLEKQIAALQERVDADLAARNGGQDQLDLVPRGPRPQGPEDAAETTITTLPTDDSASPRAVASTAPGGSPVAASGLAGPAAAAPGTAEGTGPTATSIDSSVRIGNDTVGISSSAAVTSSTKGGAQAAVLTINGQAYPVEDIKQVVIPSGVVANEETILTSIAAIQDNLRFDVQDRAVVEVIDRNTGSARLYYVKRIGRQLSLLLMPRTEVAQQVGRIRKTLAGLKGHLSESKEVELRRR